MSVLAMLVPMIVAVAAIALLVLVGWLTDQLIGSHARTWAEDVRDKEPP